MVRWPRLAVCAAVLMAVLIQPAAAESQDLTLSLPGLSAAKVTQQEASDFATYPLIVDKINQRGGIKGNISATRTTEGELLQTTYRLDSGTAQVLMQALADDLTDTGYQQLFDCDGNACGATFTQASPGYRQAPDQFDLANAAQYYRAYRKPGALGGRYVAVQVAQADADAPLAIQVDVLQAEPRVVGAITVNAAEMAHKLQTEGRVALYGLFFATDSAEIKPASRATLGEIAKLMQQKSDLRLLVVGHTDNQGSFDYNLKLSKRRAHAVVDALVNEYDIDAQRLKPWGVSYAAPTSSNGNAVGRSHNRRVELVVW